MAVKCRVLTFLPGDDRYERIYAACLHWSVRQPATRAELRCNGSLQDKLEGVGVLLPAVDPVTGQERPHKAGELRFFHCPDGGTVTLDAEEYRLACEHMESAIPRVHRQYARQHEAAFAWLESIPEQDAAPVADAAA
jgi:hypothetical protein